MDAKDVLCLIMDFVVPDIGGTIVNALDTLGTLCYEMKENEVMCRRVFERLQFFWDELRKIEDEGMLRDNQVLPKYGGVIANFMNFLKKHSRKKLLSRLASSRKLAEEVQEFHTEIDFLFKLLNLVHIAEMSAWKIQWEKDQQTQREQMQQLVNNTHLIASELRGGALVEALTEIKYEIEVKGANNAPEHVDLMRQTFMSVVRTSKAKVPRIPKWFIPRDDVHCPKQYFDIGSCGTVHHGTWGKGSHVVIKRLLMDIDGARKAFFKEVELWSQLDHPHVIKLYGGCHVSSPMFFVCEDATNGNFVEYFEDPDNKHHMWRLFYEAALGLEYLHKNKVVHGNLKCNNLLVGMDNKARICDFGFSFIRSQSGSEMLTTKAHIDDLRWKALECMDDTPVNRKNSMFESDVYSFGMCIIEAVTGEAPWGMADDNTILDNLMEGVGHPRPDGLTDQQWDLVNDLCKIDASERVSLLSAIDTLKALADTEEHEEKRIESMRRDRLCSECKFVVPSDNVFCGRCGSRIGTFGKTSALEWQIDPNEQITTEEASKKDAAQEKRKGDGEQLAVPAADDLGRLGIDRDARIDRVDVFIQELPLLSQELRDKLPGHVRQVKLWSQQEAGERQDWELNAPTTSMCDDCSTVNPLDNLFCCECGSLIYGYRSHERAAFRLVVSNLIDLDSAIQAFEELRVEGADSAGGDVKGWMPGKHQAQFILEEEIRRLRRMLQYSREEKARLLSLTKEEPQLRACSRCRGMNPEYEIFCRDCGNDIEVIRRQKKL